MVGPDSRDFLLLYVVVVVVVVVSVVGGVVGVVLLAATLKLRVYRYGVHGDTKVLEP